MSPDDNLVLENIIKRICEFEHAATSGVIGGSGVANDTLIATDQRNRKARKHAGGDE